MSSVNYVQTVNGTYQPINIVASSGIKCQHCNQLINPNKLDQHLNNHLSEKNPYYHKLNVFSNKAKTPKSINLASILNNQDNDDVTADNISVKSMLPEQLANAQKQWRPQAFKIDENSINHYNKTGLGNFQIDLWQNFNLQNLEEQLEEQRQTNYCDFPTMQPSYEQQLMIKKKLPLQKQNIQICKKKTLNVFSNQPKTDKPLIDLNSHQTKTQNKFVKSPLEESNQNIYTIQRRQSPNKLKVQPENQNKLHISIGTQKKTARHHEKISTLSTSRGFFSKTNRSNFFDFNQSNLVKKNDDTQTNQQDDQPDPKFECHSCHGFYCYACGSNIPPIYRPVPNKNGVYPTKFKKQIDKFYQHYPQNPCSQAHSCQNCK